MRKRRSLLIAVMVIAATAATLFVGCKKEKDEAATNADRSEAQALLNRIEAFQTLRDAVNSGEKADGSMTVEEMRQALDLVSNYEHSEHMTYCENTVLDTLHVTMPAVDGEGYVSNADVVATYNAFETALEKCMLGVNDGMNVPSYFSIVMPNGETKDGSDINVVFSRGVPSNDSLVAYPGPFGEDDDWYWGEDRGKCDGTCYGSDAADQLSLRFAFDNTPPGPGWILALSNVEYVEYIAIPTLYTSWNPYVYYEDTNPEGCSDHWLFAYRVTFDDPGDIPCIGHDEWNCYWRNIRRLICLPSGPLHYSPTYHSPYNQCQIIDRDLYPKSASSIEIDFITDLVHTARVRYCGAHWIDPNPVQ